MIGELSMQLCYMEACKDMELSKVQMYDKGMPGIM